MEEFKITRAQFTMLDALIKYAFVKMEEDWVEETNNLLNRVSSQTIPSTKEENNG